MKLKKELIIIKVYTETLNKDLIKSVFQMCLSCTDLRRVCVCACVCACVRACAGIGAGTCANVCGGEGVSVHVSMCERSCIPACVCV